MTMEEIFTKFLNDIEVNVSDNVYSTWFSKIEPISLNDDTFTVQVPLRIHVTMLGQTYKELIDNTMFSITGKHYNMEYKTEEEIGDLKKETEENSSKKKKKKEKTIDDEEWETNLNPKFTFDTFVVGDSNRLAVVSAHAVAENPGNLHNPLFLYGKSGIGKTHLMHAIGNYIVANSDKRVLYITSNAFVTDYTGIAYTEKGIDTMNYAKSFKEN